MTALEQITEAIVRDMQSKPYSNFLKQNPGIGPAVDAYLKGGARPSEASLGQNHYARARVASEDARRVLAQVRPAVPKVLSDYEQVVSIVGPVVNGRAEVAWID